MKKIVLSILIIITFFSCSSLKQKKECAKILDNELFFAKNNNKTEFDKDYKILENCGKLDSIDKVIFSPQLIGGLMVSLISENDKLTYRVIIKKIDEIRNSKEYPKQKEIIYLSEKIKVKVINKNNWDQDKLILEKIGLQGKELNDFKKFISKFNDTNIRYETAFVLFKKYKSENIKKTSFKFKEFENYEKALKTAKSEKKKILLYFTCYGAVNCRKMEEDILTDYKIKTILTENYLSYSLYVDSRKKLNEKFISKRTGKEIKTVGNKLSDLQIEKFNSNHQPYFVIIDENGNIKKKQEYTNSKEEFIEFLILKK